MRAQRATAGPASDRLAAALAPLDRLRARALKRAARWAGPLARDRERRIGVLALSTVGGAAAATLAAPLWMLALAPIVLGIPHLLADWRYCVVRSGWFGQRMLGPLALGLVGLGLATGQWAFALVGAAIVAAWPGAGEPGAEPSGVVRRRAPVRAGLAAGVALVLALVAWGAPWHFALALAHAHNLLAVALWLLWRPRRARWHWPAALGFAVIYAALWLGAGDGALADATGPIANDRWRTGYDLSGGARDPRWADRALLSFAFGQAVHYGIWLRLIRDDDRARPTPRPFARSYQAARGELGGPVLTAAALATVALIAWACLDCGAARAGYLRLASFHGAVELLALAWLVARPAAGPAGHPPARAVRSLARGPTADRLGCDPPP